MRYKVIPFLFWLALTSKLSVQKDVCFFKPKVISVYSNINFNATAVVNDDAEVNPPNIDDISLMGMTVVSNGHSDPDIEIKFTVEVHDTSTIPEKVNITLTLKNLAGCNISFASLEIDMLQEIDAFWDVGIPANSYLLDRSYINYNTSYVAVNESVAIHFLATPAGKGGTDLPEGNNIFYANIFVTMDSTTFGPIMPAICVLRVTTIKENIFYQHGFTALTFFIMLFVGIGLAILAVWLFFYIRKRRRDPTISPTKNVEKRKGKNIVMDAKAEMKNDSNTIMNISAIGVDESIVYVLDMKDKLQMHREIDNLDILSTIHVDTDLETEQNEVSIQASLMLVHGLMHNADINKGVEEKATSNLKNRLKDLNKKLDAEFKKELEAIYAEIEIKNKEKLSELLRKHKNNKEDLLSLMKNMPESEQKQTLELFDKQVQIEENELTYKLAIEQNEEVEKLRKEYSVKKRIGIKDIQQLFINDAINDAEMTSSKADWLLKQHRLQQDEIASKFDDEISMQRMILEEKLAKRQALAHACEKQEDDHKEILNQIASCQLHLIQSIKASPSLTEEQVKDQIEQVKGDLINVKDDMEKKRGSILQDLFKKLTTMKKKTLSDKISQQKIQVLEYISKNKGTATDAPIDPLSYVSGLISLKSQHRKELNDLENQIDEEHARELALAKDKLLEDARGNLKKIESHLVEKIKARGVSDDVIEKILRKHEKELKSIESKQATDRKTQENKTKAELEKRKRKFAEMRAQERQEQKDLRSYETEIVDALLIGQFAVSEEDRDKILKEHEKQLIKLENSLTLNKLRQKRILEEKIASRRAQQSEELQKKQKAEILKHRRNAENNGEEDDEETYLEELKIKKRHAEQQMALIQGLDFNFEKELDEIRTEMLKERALMLKSQEENMAAYIASLQINKAKEMAKIEEQQKAINNLKANLLDDLNSRGILTSPECERILQRHKEEQEELNEKLDKERLKQEKMLRSKLQERLQHRETLMIKRQEEEMKMLLEQATNKTAAKIRRALITHKQLVEMEKFKNKLQREITQTLEDRKQDFILQKQKIIQEEELKFLAGLVTIGNFERDELLNVLHMLFPHRTEEAILDILNKICQEDKKSNTKMEDFPQSTLAQRILKTHYSIKTSFHNEDTRSHIVKSRNVKASDNTISIQENELKSKKTFGPQDYTERAARLMQPSPQEMYRNNTAFRNKPEIDYSDNDSDNDTFYKRNEYARRLEDETKSYADHFEIDSTIDSRVNREKKILDKRNNGSLTSKDSNRFNYAWINTSSDWYQSNCLKRSGTRQVFIMFMVPFNL
ncbi:hypothetical protein Btru_043739 [Bulinus truncatus]|nr:hypothetical protein Btru_043739 [Bulinus truncatus]